MSKNAYPMDLESLQKGQLIPISDLQFILSVSPADADAFEFAVMGLQSLIHSRTELTALRSKEGLKILTDEEASIHNERERDGGIQKARRRQLKMTQVNVGNLSEGRRKIHDVSLLNGSRIIKAIDREVRSIRGGSSRNHHEQYLTELRSAALLTDGEIGHV